MLLENIRHFIAIWVYAGFGTDMEVITNAIDDWETSWEEEGRPMPELRPFVERTTAELLDQYRKEKANWPKVTDCDRLDAAFAALNQLGILARQNYEQTLTSGCAAMEIEAKRERASRPVIGFVFYHTQDTESAVSWNRGPNLAWSAFEDNDDAYVARTIIEVLRRHEIKADWRGDSNSRICVSGLRWQRRRPG